MPHPQHSIEDYARYEALLHRFGRHIQAYCARKANSAEECKELVQCVLVALWDGVGTLGDDSRPRQQNRWLQRVMRSAVGMHFRRRRSMVPIEEIVDMPESQDEGAELLDALMQHLDPDERALLQERFDGYSVVEMAERRHVEANALYQRIYRITNKLKQIYHEEYERN